MREIVLDTETTGVEANGGDRIVEIGCVELLNHCPSGRSFHCYINPERPMSEGAFRVHGLSDAFLAPQPVFAAVADEFMGFIEGARIVIHNAAFDVGFLNMEYARLGTNAPPPIQLDDVVDTLPMARRKHPGAANNLDALCNRYGIDTSRRTKHGALLDAQILAEVYVELLGGKQTSLGLLDAQTGPAVRTVVQAAPAAPRPYRSRLTDEERARHDSFRASLGAAPIWAEYIGADDPA